MTKVYEITANGTLMGEYDGQDDDEAVQSFMVDAGYESVEDCARRLNTTPEKTLAELEVNEINVPKLVAAVEDVAGSSVFQDSYGDGVALVKNVSYATYRELAQAFGLDLDKYFF